MCPSSGPDLYYIQQQSELRTTLIAGAKEIELVHEGFYNIKKPNYYDHSLVRFLQVENRRIKKIEVNSFTYTIKLQVLTRLI